MLFVSKGKIYSLLDVAWRESKEAIATCQVYAISDTTSRKAQDGNRGFFSKGFIQRPVTSIDIIAKFEIGDINEDEAFSH
jgi:hypothetical protein